MSLARVNRLLKPRDYRRILRALEKVSDTFFDPPITIYRAPDKGKEDANGEAEGDDEGKDTNPAGGEENTKQDG